MRYKNVIQTGKKSPHKEERGNDGQRVRVVWRRGSYNQTRARSRRSSYFSSGHFVLPHFPSELSVARPLPPMFCLNPIGEAIRLGGKRSASNKTAQAV